MELREKASHAERRRFARFNIVLPILLAGWVPSILAFVVSYTILSNTLESRILRDRQTVVQLIGHLVGDDLSRTAGIIDYYQTLPDAAKILSGGSSPAATQQWLESAFYSHPRVDGMFLTSADGRLVAAVPPDPGMIGKDYGFAYWREAASPSNQTYVSSTHPRFSDKRLATDIVGAVRAPSGAVIGYLGVSVLIERIGRRLSTIELADQTQCQVLDQNGAALFTKNFKANPDALSPEGQSLIKDIGSNRQGHVERNGNLYSFSPVEPTGWLAVVEQPKAVAYKPVHVLVGRMAVLTTWLMALTLIFALLGGRFYRRQTESARRLEREVVFNEKILANMPTGIAFVDPNTRRFLQANEAFAGMARRFGGFTGREITEANFDDVKIAPSGVIERVISFGAPFQLTEQPFKDEGGMTHFVNVNLLRLQDSQQTIQGVLYLVEDKTRDVTLRQELIGANAAKDQFLALLSHELRNPLSPVIAMVGELEATTPDSPQTRHALEVIRRNVELEARLIDDLLDVTRIAKGKLQLTFESVSVHEILQRAYEICSDDIQQKKLRVDFRLQAPRHYVEGDPARLQQVFWNLIKNSVKFTPAGGSITVETVNPTGEHVEIRIADTGIGIEAEKIHKIFNAFEQGQSSITRRFGGLGLGLAISKAMVDAHGGTIQVKSEGKDRGSLFTLTLRNVAAPVPAANGSDPKRPVTPELAKQHNGARRTILVVDDHKDTCTGMKMMLERRGYSITVAHTADQALQEAGAQAFDLLISDIGLPDRSGYDLMRDLQATRKLPGIAISGFGMEHDVTKAHAAGFSEHLTKPINFERLEEAIQNLFDSEAAAKA